MSDERALIIVGGGPAGLAAAIAARQAHLDYLLLEKGALVHSIFRFPRNMVFFTTPELLEIGGLPFVTPYEKPTRIEALRYYRRVADTYGLHIDFDRKVEVVERNGSGFRVRTASGAYAARFETRVVEIRPGSVTVERAGAREDLAADGVFLLSGYHPDTGLLEGAGVRIDPVTLAPEHDPESFETNVPGLYVAGAAVTGKE